MRLLHGIRVAAAMLFIVMTAVPQLASAQDDALLERYRSRRQKVTGGLMNMRDTVTVKSGDANLAAAADSLAVAVDSLLTATDSTAVAGLTAAADSLAVDSLTVAADSLALPVPPEIAEANDGIDGVPAKQKRSLGQLIMPDSMGLSAMCWASAVLPGYGQVYNKQYWKLPVLYGLVGTSLGMFIRENKQYAPLKKQYDLMTDAGLGRTPELDELQTKMIRVNTRRQIYLGAMLASYIYFIGDAAVNYKTNDVSRVKKATTLSTICPGAGQIYNHSYWKVPFVIGGFASMIYCIDWNNRGYQRFLKAYSLLTDYEANPDKYPDGPTDEFRGRYSSTFIKNLKDSYRRNRDLCIIMTGALYILNIIDAHVDAHLKDYDISDDLTFNIEPLVQYNYIPTVGDRPMYGFNISVNF